MSYFFLQFIEFKVYYLKVQRGENMSFKDKLKELNQEWISYINDQKINILFLSSDTVVDMMLHMEFGIPRKVTADLPIPTGNMFINISLIGFEIETVYTGDQDIEEHKTFQLGVLERYLPGDDIRRWSDWFINASWENHKDIKGNDISNYFWALEIEEHEKLIQKVFSDFQLVKKVTQLFELYASEEREKHFNELISKYNGTRINLISEHETLYIKFYDGTKYEMKEPLGGILK